MRSIYFLISLLLITGCKNLEEASPSQRSTFVRMFEPPYSTVVTDTDATPEGYIILGNMTRDDETTETIVFKTDQDGNRISDFVTIPGGAGKSIKYFSFNGLSGYMIVGSSIESNPSSDIVANIEIASAVFLILDENLEIVGNGQFKDERDPLLNPLFDFYGESVNVTDNGIIILGSYREGVQNQLSVPLKPLLLFINDNFEIEWTRTYDLINRNYVNGRSVHFTEGKVFWASAIERVQGDLTFSYVSIPVIQDSTVFVNNSLFGETTDQIFKAKDIQPASTSGFGFGVTGTYSLAPDGSQGNIFFLRTDINGTILPGSVKYFDAVTVINSKTSSASDATDIIDNGECLTSTFDGGFAIGATYTSNPVLGKGLKDILILKLNATGDILWTKTFGGIGDEEVVSIFETDDQGLLISGHSTIGTYSTPLLIKIDKNGELKN